MKSNWFPTQGDAKKALDEEQVKRAIDTLVSYRRKEVVITLGMIWLTLLLLIASLLVTIRAVMTFPLF